VPPNIALEPSALPKDERRGSARALAGQQITRTDSTREVTPMIRTNSDMPLAPDRCVGCGEVVAQIGVGSPLSLPTAIGIAVLLAVAVPAWAADPIIGIWKLNVAGSTFSTAMQEVPAKELTEVLREVDGNRIDLSQRGVQEDGAPVTFHITYPAQGGVATVIDGEGTEGLTFIETLVSPGNWYVTTLRDGKQVIVRHKVVSANGKTKQETVHGTDEHGQPFEQIEVYERIRQ